VSLVDKDIAEQVLKVAQQASRIIMQFYNSSNEISVLQKNDNSPVTEADTSAHDYLAAELALIKLTNLETAEVISEEGVDPHDNHIKPPCYWCVDPLDGTKEFIARTGEFSINIALIYNNRPVFGLIYSPIEQIGYLAIDGGGAYKYSNKNIEKIHSVACKEPIRVLVSRRHGKEKIHKFFEQQSLKIDMSHKGSALKFALVCEGNADLFVRSSGSSEWDNAAGHCLVKESGGNVYSLDTQNELKYGEKGSFRQKAFYVVGDVSYSWQELLKEWR
jgi:3'(2'), 5'-bisphosphate nucleotidase